MAKISGNETSLKQIIQGLIPRDSEIMRGTVIQTGPLKIQMVGDEKLIINERIAIVPHHLTDYQVRASENQTGATFDFTIHNALRTGETVHILALNRGKLYYILDRTAGQAVT